MRKIKIMTKKVRVPLIITDDLKYMLERGDKFLFRTYDSNKQNERIIKELTEGLESGKQITTDHIEKHWKADQYWIFFHFGKTGFKFIEDYQKKTTELYAFEHDGEDFGLLSLKGTHLNLQGYYVDALDFQEEMSGNK